MFSFREITLVFGPHMISFSKTSQSLKGSCVCCATLDQKGSLSQLEAELIQFILWVYHTTSTPYRQDFLPAVALPRRTTSTPVFCRAPLFSGLEEPLLPLLCPFLFTQGLALCLTGMASLVIFPRKTLKWQQSPYTAISPKVIEY